MHLTTRSSAELESAADPARLATGRASRVHELDAIAALEPSYCVENEGRPGKHAIELALIEVALLEMGEALRAAVTEWQGPTAIADLLHTYRQRGRDQPNLYRLTTAGPLARDELTPGLEDWAGEPFLLVTQESNLAQALWSFAHGMVILEIDDRYPAGSDLDRTWASGARAFQAAARTR